MGHDGYCVRCQSKRPMADAKVVITKNHRKMMKGHCITCKAKMNKFVKSTEGSGLYMTQPTVSQLTAPVSLIRKATGKGLYF